MMREGKDTPKSKDTAVHNNKSTGCLLLIFGILFYLAAPFILWKILAIFPDECFYRFWKVEAIQPDALFAFAGSYLGLAGSIVFGIVAYRQTKIIDKQNQIVSSLQETVLQTQVSPIIEFIDAEVEVIAGADNGLSMLGDCERRLRNQYGKKIPLHGGMYVIVTLHMQSRGLHPVQNVVVKLLEWSVAGRTFRIVLQDGKGSIYYRDEIYIVIDEKDVEENEASKWFQMMVLNKNYQNNTTYEYETSELAMEMIFENYIKEETRYQIGCRLTVNDKGKLHGKPYILDYSSGR